MYEAISLSYKSSSQIAKKKKNNYNFWEREKRLNLLSLTLMNWLFTKKIFVDTFLKVINTL